MLTDPGEGEVGSFRFEVFTGELLQNQGKDKQYKLSPIRGDRGKGGNEIEKGKPYPKVGQEAEREKILQRRKNME